MRLKLQHKYNLYQIERKNLFYLWENNDHICDDWPHTGGLIPCYKNVTVIINKLINLVT